MFLTARYYSFPQPFAHTSVHTHTHTCSRAQQTETESRLGSSLQLGLAGVIHAFRDQRLLISAGVGAVKELSKDLGGGLTLWGWGGGRLEYE